MSEKVVSIKQKRRQDPEADEIKGSKLVDQILASCTNDWTLLHDAQKNTYASIPNNGIKEFWPLDTTAIEDLIRYRAYRGMNLKSISPHLMTNVVSALKTVAKFEGEEVVVENRVASLGDSIFYDLCDERWSVVECKTDGTVSMCEDSPVKFFRTTGTAQVIPNLDLNAQERKDALRRFRKLMGFKDKRSWILLQAFLVSCFRRGIPQPIFVVECPHGSGKSTVANAIVRMIDPSILGLTNFQDDPRDFLATNADRWLIAGDNISHLSNDLQDMMATISTGITFSQRKLNTNKELVIYKFKNPQMFTCIKNPSNRADFDSRTITVWFELADAERLEDLEFVEQFEALRADVLGALLYAVAGGLKRLPTVSLNEKPRLADFTKWVIATEADLDMDPGDFWRAYQADRSNSIETLLSENVLANVIQSLELPLKLNPTSFLNLIRQQASESDRFSLPKSPKSFTAELERLKPSLFTIGILINRGKSGDRYIEMSRFEPKQLQITQEECQ